MHKLVIQDDEGKTTVVPLIRDEITIGRKEGNTIRLTERNVSRKHARLVRNNGSIAIEDLNSYNGVKVNGSRIQGRVSIALTDRIQIGDYLLELKLDNAQAPSPIAIQPTQPIHSVAPSIVNAVAAGGPMTAGASGTAIPKAAHDEAPTTRMDEKLMQEYAQSQPSLPPPVPAVATAVSSPSLPPVPPDPSQSPPSMPSMPSIPPVLPTPAPAPGAAPPAQQAQAAVDPKQSGRLVILSRNFAGREYVLDRPALVIGRTEDNDIVINHRSISRHHAKVVQENGRYAIVDLQSSNGVRVNGEEYGKVELRRGDVIDLGHVRIRFVEPGESFVFTPAMAVDVGSGGGGKGMWIAIGAIVIGAILFGVFVIGGGGGGKSGDAQGTQGVTPPDVGAQPQPVVAPRGDAGVVPTPPQVDNDALLDALKRAEGASSDKKWSAAKQAAEQALALDPGNEKATAIAEQATREIENEKLLDELEGIAKRRPRALADADFARAAELFGKVTVESAHKEDARAAHDRVMKAYADRVTAEATQLTRARKCDEADALAAKAAELSEAAGEKVAAIAGKCTRPVAVRRNPPPRDPTPTGTGDSGTSGGTSGGTAGTSGGDDDDDPEARSRKPTKSFKEYLDEARSATKAGLYAAALKACRNALKLRSSDTEALTTCALASCKLGRGDAAKKYTERIRSNDRKGMIRQVCLQSGVTLD